MVVDLKVTLGIGLPWSGCILFPSLACPSGSKEPNPGSKLIVWFQFLKSEFLSGEEILLPVNTTQEPP